MVYPPVPEAASCLSWYHLFQREMKAAAWMHLLPAPLSTRQDELVHSQVSKEVSKVEGAMGRDHEAMEPGDQVRGPPRRAEGP